MMTSSKTKPNFFNCCQTKWWWMMMMYEGRGKKREKPNLSKQQGICKDLNTQIRQDLLSGITKKRFRRSRNRPKIDSAVLFLDFLFPDWDNIFQNITFFFYFSLCKLTYFLLISTRKSKSITFVNTFTFHFVQREKKR